jgi:hypothetical protein
VKTLLSRWIGVAKEKLLFRIKVDPNHMMIILLKAIDWEYVLQVVEEQRQKNIKNGAGRKPHLRILTGAVIVRVLESCTLRKAQDLIQHYGPARALCNLRWSIWTPNFRTLSDFEIMLGADGLVMINAYILKVARELGFADVRGLCSDTTAQEANIPYPTEVGLMSSLCKSIAAATAVLKGKIRGGKTSLLQTINKIKKLTREHRLFAKSAERKREIEWELLALTQTVSRKLAKIIPNIGNKLVGHQKTAHRRLIHLQGVFTKLAPQMAYFFQKSKVAKDKIISLFQPELRSIPRGKSGKPVEFGIKWGINRIRGGFVWLFQLHGPKKGEADYMVQAVREHTALFGTPPDEFAYDRGGWSEAHLQDVENQGVKRVAVAPKGKSKWKVSSRCKERMVRERAQVEGSIGTIKHIGFNKPQSKTTPGMIRAGHRAALRLNLTTIIRKAHIAGIDKIAA